MRKTSLFLINSLLVSLLIGQFLVYVYATEIFSDGFESGNFNAWTGTSGTPTVVTTTPHHGGRCMECNANLEFAHKTITSINEIYVRIYVRTSATPASNIKWQFIGFRPDVTNEIGGVGIYDQAGTDKIEFDYWDGSNWQTIYGDAVTWSINTYYCFEVRLKTLTGAGNDEIQVWIDGTQRLLATGLTFGYNTIANVPVGNYYISGGTIPTNRFDCVVVADTYIGPEATGQEFTYTLTETSSFSATSSLLKETQHFGTETFGTTEALTWGKELAFSGTHLFSITDMMPWGRETISQITEAFIPEWQIRILQEKQFLPSETFLTSDTLSWGKERQLSLLESFVPEWQLQALQEKMFLPSATTVFSDTLTWGAETLLTTYEYIITETSGFTSSLSMLQEKLFGFEAVTVLGDALTWGIEILFTEYEYVLFAIFNPSGALYKLIQKTVAPTPASLAYFAIALAMIAIAFTIIWAPQKRRTR